MLLYYRRGSSERNRVIIMNNMKELDDLILKYLNKEVDSVISFLTEYENSCKDCRCFNDYLIRKTVGTINMYSVPKLRKEYIAPGRARMFCETCGRCVFDDV